MMEYCVRKKNVCVFINVNLFSLNENLFRKGAEKDNEKLLNLFSAEFLYQTFNEIDLKWDDLQQNLNDLRNKWMANNDALFIIIDSHGNSEEILCTDMRVKYNTIINMFNDLNSSSLKGRPKIIIFNACRSQSPTS